MKRILCTFCLLALAALPVPAQGLANMHRNAEKVARALYYIQNHYVDTVDMDRAVDAMLAGLMEQLDPHSTYFSRDQVEAANEPLDGSFEGVGIEYALIADTLTVQAVIFGGPAESVGLLPGDKIVAIDGETVAGTGLTVEGVRSRLRGPKGTRVDVTVLRGTETLDFSIVRDTIPIESVDAAYMPEKDVVYIKLSRFAQNTVQEVIDAFRKFSERRPRGVIFDLRGNSGGFMHVAIHLADIFLEDGQTIVRTEGNGIEQTEAATGIGFYKEGPLVVMVDENSASASEILAGALQDWDRAVIVGRRTFGKGLVQRQYDLPDGSEIRLTVARYHTPCGRVVQSPYEKGHREAYYRQAQERYARGESFSRDSIALPDSLLYHTLRLGRPVYGGGGIIPDVFVPYDTLGINRYVTRVIGSGMLTEYVNGYTDKNRKSLAAKDLDGFLTRWKKQEASALEALRNFCADKGVKADEAEWEECLPILRTRLKALLARNVLGTTAYWQVINREEDPEFLRALEVINNWKGDFPTGL